MLLPALAKAKLAAKGTQCRSNLHQWVVAFTMYTMDNKERYPTGWMPNQPNSVWMGACQPYYQNTNICLCPLAIHFRSDLPPGGGTGQQFDANLDTTFYSWGKMGINGYPVEVWGNTNEQGSYEFNGNLYGLKTTTIGGSLQFTPVFGDGMWDGTTPTAVDLAPIAKGVQNGNGLCEFALVRHGGRNPEYMSYLDSSVRPTGLKQLWVLHWSPTWVPSPPAKWPKWMANYN